MCAGIKVAHASGREEMVDPVSSVPPHQTNKQTMMNSGSGGVCGNDVRGNDVRGNDVRGNDVRGNDVRGNDVRGNDGCINGSNGNHNDGRRGNAGSHNDVRGGNGDNGRGSDGNDACVGDGNGGSNDDRICGESGEAIGRRNGSSMASQRESMGKFVK
jgi:hypothetical protein